MKTVISILTVTQSLSPVLGLAHDIVVLRGPATLQISAPTPQCETSGASELTITCEYAAGSPVDADSRTSPRILLDRAVISFIPSNDSHMHVELTFTNDSGGKIIDQRIVYLAIDDENGENHLRRSLPHVDFAKLEPSRPMTFQETLQAPAFAPGRYIVSIWIPSTDPSFKFDRTHNFLLSSKGVSDPATGLNQIARFTITTSGRRKSTARPD